MGQSHRPARSIHRPGCYRNYVLHPGPLKQLPAHRGQILDYQISVAQSDVIFRCEVGETVLDAAERSGYSVPYSCRKGVCSTCEGGVVTGEGRSTVQGDVAGPAGSVLLCCLRPSSDMTIAPRKFEKREPVVRKTLDMTVYRVM